MAKLSSTISMWVFTIVIVVGLIMTICNLNNQCVFSKFDGVILTIIGTFASIITAMTSNYNVHRIFTGTCY